MGPAARTNSGPEDPASRRRAEPALRERFVREARPRRSWLIRVVPVYDLGQLPDGRLWFAMQEVTGRTYGQVISAVHQASPDCWRVTHDGWSLRRLVEALPGMRSPTRTAGGGTATSSPTTSWWAHLTRCGCSTGGWLGSVNEARRCSTRYRLHPHGRQRLIGLGLVRGSCRHARIHVA